MMWSAGDAFATDGPHVPDGAPEGAGSPKEAAGAKYRVSGSYTGVGSLHSCARAPDLRVHFAQPHRRKDREISWRRVNRCYVRPGSRSRAREGPHRVGTDPPARAPS